MHFGNFYLIDVDLNLSHQNDLFLNFAFSRETKLTKFSFYSNLEFENFIKSTNLMHK